MGSRRRIPLLLVTIGLLLAEVSSQGQQAGRTVLFFIDDLHIEFRNTPRLRTGMRQATERLLGAGGAVAVISDGGSSITIRPTHESAPLLQVANRIAGGGLRADETASPTPAITADMKRRESVADATFQSTLTMEGLEGILYVTERQMQPIQGTIPVVVTRPEGMDAAVAQLLSLK